MSVASKRQGRKEARNLSAPPPSAEPASAVVAITEEWSAPSEALSHTDADGIWLGEAKSFALGKGQRGSREGAG